ncbi:MAG: Rubrerythrin [Desulfurella sp.]|uniref:ferritin family protein n=1 Tax=Desulfurella sp. TaxID=1962857 RepID=UPI000CB57378|nr:ferritin family protein [Desulfurella sp.]PMP93468.1 MAG: Rubrerythrin [Desulfurella sp.]
MNAIDYALALEEDGKNYYNEQALKAKKEEIRSLFLMLAADEIRHYKIIEKFKEGVYEYLPTSTFDNVPNLFKKLKNQNSDFSDEQNLLDVYSKAIKIEIDSRDFYKQKSLESDNENEKNILQLISKEEDKHKIILENLMEFIRKGQEWVESAEFSHIEEQLRKE